MTIRDQLTKQATDEARAMASRALDKGLVVPAPAVDALARFEDAKKAHDAGAVPLSTLARVHAVLSKVVAPASPGLLVALHEDGAERGRPATGQLPIVRGFMAAAAISLVVFIGVSITPQINDPARGNFFTSAGLPLLVNELFYLSAAAVGASFSGLFQVNREISKGTFVPRLASVYWVQLVLGISAGFLMATVLNINSIAPSEKTGATRLVFSGALLALIGGFSSSVVQTVVERMNAALESIVRGSARQEIEVREKAGQLQIQEAIAKERMRTAVMMNDIARRLASGESPVSLIAVLDQAGQSTLAGEAQPLPPPVPGPPYQPPGTTPPATTPEAFEVAAILEGDDGAPLVETDYELRRDGQVIASGKTDKDGRLAAPVPGKGDYEILVYGEEVTPRDLPTARGLSAFHAMRGELSRGIAQYGAGKTWETAGSNRGPLVDQYISTFMSPQSGPPWCGMFVGYCYLKAGFKTAGTLPASQTTDGTSVPRKTMFMSATRLMLYFKGAKRPFVEFPKKSGGPSTRDACKAWLDKNLAGFSPRSGDIMLCHTGGKDYSHVGMVAAYDPSTCLLTTYEGNYGNRAGAWQWDLTDPSETGFYRVSMLGRLGEDDFDPTCEVPPEGPSSDPVVEKGGVASAT